MALSMVTVTGTLQDAAGGPLNGEVSFTPSTGAVDALGNPVITSVTDVAGSLIVAMTGVTERLNRGGFSVDLVPTDSAGLLPAGWMYQVTIQVPGIPDYGFTCFIPSSPDPVDLSALTPTESVAQFASYLPLSGGTMTGALTLAADPTASLQAATKHYVDNNSGGGAVTSVNTQTGAVVLTAASVGADASGAAATETSRAETAEALLAPKASPALTGTPTAPTATALTDSTQVATTAYADSAVAVEKTRALAAEALRQYVPVAAPLPSGDTTGATDTAALNTALAALSAREALILPVPGYWINAPLSLPAGCGITGTMGYGVSSPHIKAATGFTGTAMIANAAYLNSLRTGDDGCEVSNLYIDGSNGAAGGPFVSSNGHGILLTGSHHHVHHNYVWNTSGAGIVMADFNNSAQSVNSGVTQENYVWDNKVNNSGQWGIWVSKTSGSVGCTDGVIARNIISDPSDGTYYAAGNGNPQINPATNQAYEAIRLDNAAGWWVTDNHTYYCPGGAIVVSGVYSTHALNNTCDIFGVFPWSVVSSVLTATTIIGMAVHTIKTDLAPYGGITSNQKPSIISGNRMDAPEGKSTAPISPASGTSSTGCRLTYYDLTADTLAVPAGAVGEADIVFTGNQSHQSSRGGQTAASCTTTNGSATVTAAGGTFAAVVQKGMSVTGTGIPGSTYVGSVVTGGSDSLTLVASDLATPVTATASGTVTLTFPAPYSLSEKWTATTAGVTLNAQHAANLAAGTIIAAPLINATNGAVINLRGEFGGVVVSGVPSAGQAPVASSASASAWASILQAANNLSDVASQQTALNNLAGAVTSGDYLRGNGTNVSMSAIQAADLPAGTTGAKGALQLDGTAGDITALGAQAAGAVGKAADAGHVHPTTGLVTGVTAADTSIVTGGTSQAPTVATGTLDVIATQHPPAGNWSNNSHKITSLANGTAGTDAAAFGQIPTSAAGIGGLLAANNLSDVASASTARTSLGLGAAALIGTPVSVANGGTGDTSLTAYTLLAGGTTSSGAVQSLAGTGTGGQYVTSAGASALPVLQGPWNLANEPTGTLATRIPVVNVAVGTLAALTTGGQVSVGSIGLPAGMLISNIAFLSGSTPANGPTHWWVALLDSTLHVLAVSTDQTSTAITANTFFKLAVSTGSGAYTVASTGIYYVAISASATTTAPTLAGVAANAPGALTPVTCGTASTQAAPPSVAAQINSGTITPAGSSNFAAWLS